MAAHSAAPLSFSAPRTRPDAPTLPLGFARGTAFVALAAFGALHWMQMLAPAQPARAWSAVGIGVLVSLVLLAAARARRSLRMLACVVVTAGAFVLALLSAGVADELLQPSRWDQLAVGIGRGLDAVAGVRIPYRGLDPWIAVVIALGGALLVALAGALAFWPRRRGRTGYPLAALSAAVVLYVVPATALALEAEFVRGAVLAILVVAFLTLERVRMPDVPSAGVGVAVAALLGLAAAPLLDGSKAWFDYESWALSAAKSESIAFSWEHDYGPLGWPREGRELLRVKAKRSAYWKAENLDVFDGQRWRRGIFPQREAGAWDQLPGDIALQAEWAQTMSVTMRALQTRTFVVAGTTLRPPQLPGRQAFPTGSAGIYVASGTLHRGDSYSVRVYTPRPEPRDLTQSGSNYAPWLPRYTSVRSSHTSGDVSVRVYDKDGRPEPGTTIVFPLWDAGGHIRKLVDYGNARWLRADDILQRRPYARIWPLVQRLKRQSDTAYDYVQAVAAHLGSGYTYSEAPPASAKTLDGFLFDARTGYCQQFSGAMALMLRMGGVPARVSAGFTSGAYDEDTGEYVVRDTDAHSWVEVWFPSYGWVPFDPTPAAAPPRSQGAGPQEAAIGVGDISDDRPGGPASGFGLGQVRAGGEGDGAGLPWAQTLAAVVLASALAGVAILVARARRATVVTELERALRCVGQPSNGGTTLAALEQRFHWWPGAVEYLRAVRAERYGGAPTGPTAAQRRALRAALAGRAGWLRAWWALPPRLGG